MASTIATEKATALGRGESSQTSLNSALGTGGHAGNLVAILVPVAYKVAVVKAPASALTDADAKTLAEDLGLEFYEE